jgi:type IV secretion system protein TrbL
VLMVLVLGIGVQFTTGVANGLTGVQGAIGTAVPGVILICVATVSPLALFKLLAFVDPATTSGASLRAGLSAMGSVQGLLGGTGAGSNQAAATDGNGRSAGEDGADDATSSRFTSSLQGGMSRLGAAGQVTAQGLGVMAGIGGTGAAVGADLSNQMGVGHPTYPPDFSRASLRANYGTGDAYQADFGYGSDGDAGSEADPYPGADSGGYPDAGALTSPAAGTSIEGAGSAPISGGSMLAGPGNPGAAAAGGGAGAGAAAGEAGVADAAIVLI